VAVVPDRLVFEGDEKVFRIINPNNETITFEAKGKHIECLPEKGEIRVKESATVACRAADHVVGETVILVETRLKNAEESVGVLPAVAVKVKIVGEENVGEENDNYKESISGGASQSTIDKGVQEAGGVEKEKGRAGQEEKKEGENAKRGEGEKEGDAGKEGLAARQVRAFVAEMKPELITIVFLVAAIISVLVYSEIKERKKGKQEKENNDNAICPSGLNKDPRQEKDQSTGQGSCPPLCELLEETSRHSQKNMSGSSGSPRN
jgi:hypothetical protein